MQRLNHSSGRLFPRMLTTPGGKPGLRLGLILLTAIFAQGNVQAQAAFPARTVQIVAPYAAGGPVDIVARVLGSKLSASWGQPVIVENRAGAGGNIGTAYVARAKPDGHTLLVNTPAMLITPLLSAGVDFDPIADFTPIARIGLVPALLITNKDLPVTNVKELIELAKAKPGQLNYASPGAGTSLHLAAAMFASMAGINVTHIPYKGGAQALPQLTAGATHMMFDPIIEALPLVRAGKLNAIAISTAQRSPMVPEVPTVAESGLPGYDFAVWYAVFGPADMPAPLRDRLGRDIIKVLQQPDVVSTLENLGIALQAQGPDEFESAYQQEQSRWQTLIETENLGPQK